MAGDCTEYCYLLQTLAWMGGNLPWPADMIAEQLGDFDDPRIHRDLEAAVRSGLLMRVGEGYQLTDAGWEVAASQA
jgi:hypothetical protein